MTHSENLGNSYGTYQMWQTNSKVSFQQSQLPDILAPVCV